MSATSSVARPSTSRISKTSRCSGVSSMRALSSAFRVSLPKRISSGGRDQVGAPPSRSSSGGRDGRILFGHGGLPAAGPQEVDGFRIDDAVEPGAQAGLAAEVVHALQGGGEGLLDGVGGHVRIAGDAQGEGVQAIAVLDERLGQRFPSRRPGEGPGQACRPL